MSSHVTLKSFSEPLLLVVSVWVALAGTVLTVHAAIVATGDVSPSDPTTWNSNTVAYIGKSSEGSLTVDAASGVVSGFGDMAYESGSRGTATITGTGSTWTMWGNLVVGLSGSALLNIESGGQVSNQDGIVAANIGSTGTATVTGTGSMWSNSNFLRVGAGGNGTLKIETGAQVTSNYGSLGDKPGSNGTVTVAGTGSTWTDNGFLYVGNRGSGTLIVTDGGTVNAKTLYASLGDLSGNGRINAKGVVLDADIVFDGSPTTQRAFAFGSGGALNLNLDGTGDMGAGYNSAGSMHIADGNAVGCSYGYLGYKAGSSGVATVVGAGSRWNANSFLFVGYSGSGVLQIEAGGQVSDSLGYLGRDAGSSGTAIITGIGSRWTNTSILYVGNLGSGSLTVSDGGIVTTKTLCASLGDLCGNGTITAHGAVLDADLVFDGSHGLQQSVPFGSGGALNMNVDGTGNMGAGYHGAGTLQIVDEVTVASGYGYLGYQSGSVGMATISGNGSKWKNNNDFYVGNSGNGVLRIEAGGQASDGNAYLGNNAGSTGSVTVTGVGSTWNNSYDLYVGKSGNGSLTVSNGGLVTAKTLYASLGDLFGDGAITTKGALLDADLVFDSSQGAQPTIHFGTNGSLNLNVDGSAAMGVGYKANGTLRIADGLTVISSIAYLGYNESSVGLATVSGKGSRWTNNSYFYVGSSGMGILNVKEGGQVTSNTYTTYVGYNPTSNGTIAVNGIGSVWTNNNLVVGYYGNGTLNIEAGGQVISNYNSVGTQPGAVGTVTVTGAGSKWINNFTNDLQVGVSGSGTLNIESGGLVMTLSMILANSAKSSGMCNISDGGVLQTATLRQGNGIASVNWNDGVIQNYNPNTNLAVSSNLTIRLASTGTHAFNVDSGRTGTVDAVLTDATSGGTLKKIGAGTLVLTAANSYSGETEVEYGTLSVRVPYLEDHADIRISSGALLDLNFSGSDTVRSLYLDGLLAEVGTWGSSQSRAAHIDNAHFSGAGMLNVTVPEPSTVALLLAASLGGLLYVRNKSWRTR